MSPVDSPDGPQAHAALACQAILVAAGVAALVWQILSARRQEPVRVEPWRARWLDFGIWFWVIYCSVFIAAQLLSLLLPTLGDRPADDFGVLVRGIIIQCVVLFAQLAMVLTHRRWSPAPLNRVSLSPRRVLAAGALAWLAAYPIIVAASLGWQGILEMARHFWPNLTTPSQEAVTFLAKNGNHYQTALLVFFAVAVAPMNEELFFRAGLYRFLKGRVNPRLALLGVSFLFALVHANLLTLLPLFAIGVLLGLAYERSGNIAVPIVFHALFNLTNIVQLLLFPELFHTLGPSP